MIFSLKHLFYITVTFTVTSCVSQKTTNRNSIINTKYNEEYIASTKTLVGKLDESQYAKITTVLAKELNTVLSKDKAILINYSQKAPNCITEGHSKKNDLLVSVNGIRLSNEISKKYNAADFFVYAADTFVKDLRQENFILDTGFFYNNVFTLHENCKAFFILKPNGDFMKYYGEDYYSLVNDFLEKK